MKMIVRFLGKDQCRSLKIFSRLYSSQKIEGIRGKFSEYEVRLKFDQWLKSLWLVSNKRFIIIKYSLFVEEVGT